MFQIKFYKKIWGGSLSCSKNYRYICHDSEKKEKPMRINCLAEQNFPSVEEMKISRRDINIDL